MPIGLFKFLDRLHPALAAGPPPGVTSLSLSFCFLGFCFSVFNAADAGRSRLPMCVDSTALTEPDALCLGVTEKSQSCSRRHSTLASTFGWWSFLWPCSSICGLHLFGCPILHSSFCFSPRGGGSLLVNLQFLFCLRCPNFLLLAALGSDLFCEARACYASEFSISKRWAAA